MTAVIATWSGSARTISRPASSRQRCPVPLVYQRLADRGKPHKVAITAVIRKLVVLANALLRDDRLWQPQVPAKA